jgi:uncharacterized protein (DUF2147 family)
MQEEPQMRTPRALFAVVFPAMFAVAAFAVAAPAADISGRWKAEYKTTYGGAPRESGETTFTFKQNGEELTGTVTSTALGEVQIREGKVSGDDVSFVVSRSYNGRERKMTYAGKVAGDEITFQTSMEGFGRGLRMIAKKLP